MPKFQVNSDVASVSIEGIEYTITDDIIDVPDAVIPRLAEIGVSVTSITTDTDKAAANKAAADKAAADKAAADKAAAAASTTQK